MFKFTSNNPIPDYGLFGVNQKFSRIALQMTSLCHNRCCFCPLHQDKKTPKGTMDLDTLKHVLKSINDFDGLVDLATDGESIVLDDLPVRCSIIKQYWPKSTIAMTSTFNIDRGYEFVQDLFNSGLDKLTISCYAYTEDDYYKIHGSQSFSSFNKNINYLKNLPAIHKSKITLKTLYHREAFDISNAEEKFQNFKQELVASDINNFSAIRLHSWQNRVPFGTQGTRKAIYPCSVVWGGRANSLNIRWNLEIVPCCFFSGFEFSFGNLKEKTITQIFTSKKFIDFYNSHWNKEENDITVCKDCTNYRTLSSGAEHRRLAAWQGHRLKGVRVWFWGAGEAWNHYKIFFKKTEPQGMILDSGHNIAEIDTLKIYRPEEILSNDHLLPIVIFAYPQNSAQIVKKIFSLNPHFPHELITVCPAEHYLESE